MRGLSAPRTWPSVSSTSRPGSTWSGVGSDRFASSCLEADHLPPALCQVMLSHVPECGPGSSSCTAGAEQAGSGPHGRLCLTGRPWSGLGDLAALTRRPTWRPLHAALRTHPRSAGGPFRRSEPDARRHRSPAAGPALYGFTAPKRAVPGVEGPRHRAGPPSWTSTARYPGGTGGPRRRRGRWDRLLPVGVDGGRAEGPESDRPWSHHG